MFINIKCSTALSQVFAFRRPGFPSLKVSTINNTTIVTQPPLKLRKVSEEKQTRNVTLKKELVDSPTTKPLQKSSPEPSDTPRPSDDYTKYKGRGRYGRAAGSAFFVIF